jgi:hypothetical protein
MPALSAGLFLIIVFTYAPSRSLISTVITRIVLLAVMTVEASSLPSTGHLTVILTIIRTALLIQVGCGLQIILDEISAKISNIYAIIFL